MGYTHKNLKEVDDAAAAFGLSPDLEARFARKPLGSTKVAVSYQRLQPGFRAVGKTGTVAAKLAAFSLGIVREPLLNFLPCRQTPSCLCARDKGQGQVDLDPVPNDMRQSSADPQLSAGAE